ncbi:hypothetical protein M2103_002434 [Ereboglobus sp. PH5-5]|uniref:hypothetical protein n=1 Tax=unclassified Ereboglobus TaxID=2626932 RepID=UPI00240736E2|nr:MULTISPECIES: hypothetical protein [unclassified Ereboglobus]MDF9828329.1 hypothetical protein [Ereboglobus sp. PH5-10]MDF9834192.1 hypothetical protein [Ereboglobus sp. PH5-5]
MLQKMLLLREKIQIVLIALGMFFCGFGFALFKPFATEEEPPSPPVHKVGFWKDGGISKEAGRRFAPWVMAAGVVSFAGAFLMRDRR